jgi:CheY-like chemotaxis protein
MAHTLNHILLIDDDDITNFINERVIKRDHLANTITVMHRADHALQYLSTLTDSEKPNLILLDINMPAMNGWEFIEEYKKIDAKITEDIILVMLTTSINPDDKIKAQENTHINDFKVKPLSSEILTEIIHTHFNLSTSK